MVSDGQLTIPELDYMLVGEKMSDGASLYNQLWENIAPLSAGVYLVIDFLFGRSQNAYYWVSLFVVFFQCFLFNRLLLINKAYNENTYVPGLIYTLFMSFFFDFLTLTPVVMSQTFILLALNNIFSHIEFKAKRDEKILNIGIYLGLAALFYLPNVIFGFATLLIFMFFTGTVLRRYLLMLFGFCLPLLMAATFYLVTGRLGNFIYSFINPLISFNTRHYIDNLSLLVIFVVPILLLLAAFVRINQRARFTNYQSRLVQAMFVWLLFCVLFILISDIYTPSIFIVFVPPLAFYISHYLLLIRKRFIAEIILLLFFASCILINHGTRFDFFFTKNYIDLSEYIVPEGNKELANKKVLILDEKLELYVNCKPATPFLDWHMVKNLFANLDYYDNQAVLYEGFINDMPEIIIDSNNVMPNVFDKMPTLKAKYTKRGGYYYLKS